MLYINTISHGSFISLTRAGAEGKSDTSILCAPASAFSAALIASWFTGAKSVLCAITLGSTRLNLHFYRLINSLVCTFARLLCSTYIHIGGIFSSSFSGETPEAVKTEKSPS